jgi:hypothetical protein
MKKSATLLLLLTLFCGLRLLGQVQAGTPANDAAPKSSVPLFVKFSGTLLELNDAPLSGSQSVVFSLYEQQIGGTPLWSETQTILPSNQGTFTVLLGSKSSLGIPASTFASGLPRWAGITPNDGVERPRVALVSVPYALKAVDADTLGGMGPDQFVSVQQLGSILSGLKFPHPNPIRPIVTIPIAAAPGRLPSFEAMSPIGPSFVSDATSGPPFQVASASIVPSLNADLLHGLTDAAFAKISQGNVFSQMQSLGGGLDLPASSPETDAPNLVDSSSLNFDSSSTDSQTYAKTTQRFSWVSEPTPGPSGSPSARLSLSFSTNGSRPLPTGLSINADGTISFSPAQQLLISGTGSIGPSTGGAGPGPGGPNNPVANTAAYDWADKPQSGIQAGPNSVKLVPCPGGVNGADLWHYLYVTGTGTPEIVLITGGSCVSRASGGTVEFTAAYAHPSGYSIGTASDGIQEAVIDADMTKTGGKVSRQVMIDPGSHVLRARVSIRSSSMTVNSSGATLICAMSDTCIMAGDPANGDMFQSIVLQGLNVAPGIVGGTWPAIEDNAQGTNISGVSPQNSSVSRASFGSLVQVDNDQAATIQQLTTTTSYTWGRCDKSFCSVAILGPGPFSRNAGVLHVNNSNISLQCTGNGIDNQDGNTLDVNTTIVQGAAQFGIRAATVYQQNTVTLSGVYGEQDGTCNPLGTGTAGLIVEGGAANEIGSNPSGAWPVFANTGPTTDWYYIVAHSSEYGVSALLMAGYANTSGVGPIKVVWNQIGNVGTIDYDVLRQASNGQLSQTPPIGTGAYAVATGLAATAVCQNNVCSFLDHAESAPSTYTVAINTVYWPSLKLWPGNIVLTQPYDMLNSGGGNPTTLFVTGISPAAIVASAGATYPSVFAQLCNPTASWSPVWVECAAGNSVGNDNPAVGAQIVQLTGTGGSPGGYKGRLIYTLAPGSPGTSPTHVIALSDSNPTKTLSTQPGISPSWDAGDSYIGYDAPTNGTQTQISFGAPVAISNYIANTGDNVNYLERLTATGKVFRVPLQFDSVPYAQLAGLSNVPNGSTVFCLDCLNAADDQAAFDSNAAPGGHGTNLLRENDQWRVH